MANIDSPFGFRPVWNMTGGKIRPLGGFLIDTNTSGAIGRGDLVIAEATGNIEIAAADDGIKVVGVFDSCSYVDSSGNTVNSTYIPASKTGMTNIEASLFIGQGLVYQVQCDTGTAPTAADVYATANHVATAASSTKKHSLQELDASDIGTGAQCKIIRLSPIPGNVWGEHCIVEVTLNESIWHAPVAGI